MELRVIAWDSRGLYSQAMSLQLDCFMLFSDGACSGNPGPGGWAFILADTSKVLEGGGYQSQTTNNQMELRGLIEGLRRLKSTKKPLWIFSDSVYVLRGASQWAPAWSKRGWKTAEGKDVLNRGEWEELLQELSRFSKDQIFWGYVPGHRGFDGNERCDQIAVAYSKREDPDLYEGSREHYSYNLENLPGNLAIPELKFGDSAKKVPHSYLSQVDGVTIRHKDWRSCEARVKGRPGVRFKKANSAEEESNILRDWGVSADRVKNEGEA